MIQTNSKSSGIKGQKNKSKDELAEIPSKSESKANSLTLKLKDIREKINESKYTFSKPKIKEIRRHL